MKKYYHKSKKNMEIIVIFLILLNFCSGDTSYFFDESGHTNICHGSFPCKFNITKEFPLSPKIPSKNIHYEFYRLTTNYYGYYFEFTIPDYQSQKSFYVEVYDASNGENIMENSDCFLVNTTYYVDNTFKAQNIKYYFGFIKSLDDIDFVRFRFFGLLDDFSMNVVLHLNGRLNMILDYPVQIVLYNDIDDGLNKTDIEGFEKIKEEYEKNKAILDEYIGKTFNKIKELAEILFTTNIDMTKYGKDYFGSIPIYQPPFRITISYVVGLKYSSKSYYEPGITLFNSSIAKGSINLNWGSHDEFIKNIEVSNPFLGLLDIFQNHAVNLALKLVIQNDNFYFTIMIRDDCMVYTLRLFYFQGELGPYTEIEIVVCLDINFGLSLERVTNSIEDFYESIDPEWRPFVLGVCLGVVIGLTPVGAIEAGLTTVFTTVDVAVTKVYLGLSMFSATNWLTDVKKIDFIKIASDGINGFTSGLVSEFQNLGISISSWLQGFVSVQNY